MGERASVRRALLLALLAVGAACAKKPGPNDVRRLTTGTDSLAIFYARGSDTVRTGLLRDELTIVDEGDRRLVHRVYGIEDGMLGSRVDTLVDEAATLAPVRHRSWSGRGRESLDFAGGAVTGWLWLADGDSVAVQETLAAGVVNAATFDLVLRTADLRAGWTGDVAAFLPSNRSVTPLRAYVTAREKIDGEPCWRVESEFTGMPVTFWISERTRALRQQVMQVQPDAAIVIRAIDPGERDA